MTCKMEMKSQVVKGHTHTCTGTHEGSVSDHYCGKCKRRWFKVDAAPVKRVRPRRA